jgi:hypothetical protein
MFAVGSAERRLTTDPRTTGEMHEMFSPGRL